MRTLIALNGVTFIQMRSVGSYSTSGKEREGKQERMGKGSSAISLGKANRID